MSQAINIEAATAYVEACQAEARRQGHADRIRSVQGNFVDLADEISPADIVTLDRVICCYHDMPQLVGLSASKAIKLYGVVYPRDTWWVRLVVLIYYDLQHRLLRNPMRFFVHHTQDVEAVIEENGLHRCFHQNKGPWQIAGFARS